MTSPSNNEALSPTSIEEAQYAGAILTDKTLQSYDAVVAGETSAQMIDKPVSDMPPAQTSHRDGYWKPATADQIKNADKFGFDLSGQDKYFS